MAGNSGPPGPPSIIKRYGPTCGPWIGIVLVIGAFIFVFKHPLAVAGKDQPTYLPQVRGEACFLVGVLIGAFCRRVIADAGKISPKLIRSVISLLAGAAVLALFKLVAGKNANALPEYWYYPVGVVLGFFANAIGFGRASMWRGLWDEEREPAPTKPSETEVSE
jgi:hypothetical protein